jgi:hypothetical protein
VEGVDALSGVGVDDAGRELSVFGGKSDDAGIGSKVLVEGPVLLHDHDHVLDLVNAVQ